MADEGVSIIDTSGVPWEPHVIGGSIRKVLEQGGESGGYVHLRHVPPGGAPLGRQLHLSVRETFFWLYGDLPCWEYKSPADLEGHVRVYRRGTFMDRWPLSVHGRRPLPESRTGSEFLIWSSGGGEFETDPDESLPVPFSKNSGDFGDSFTAPIVIESDSLPWLPHQRSNGLLRRSLVDGDDGQGYPISLVQIPPGWSTTDTLSQPNGRCWVYGVHGSVAALFGDIPVQIGEGVYARWGPGNTVRLAPEASAGGCTLLCVGHALD